jgi:hypothetical protein
VEGTWRKWRDKGQRDTPVGCFGLLATVAWANVVASAHGRTANYGVRRDEGRMRDEEGTKSEEGKEKRAKTNVRDGQRKIKEE